MRSRGTLIACIGVLLLGIVGLNAAMNRSNNTSGDDDDAAAQTKAKPTSPDPGGDTLVRLPVDGGPGSQSRRIVIGFEWTPQVQADPGKVLDAIGAVESVTGKANVRVVNVDAVPGVKPGITIDNKLMLPAQPDGSINVEKAKETLRHGPPQP